MKLTKLEQAAVDLLIEHGGAILVTRIADSNQKDCFGDTIPGMRVFKSLEKKDIVYFTEEDSIEMDTGAGMVSFEFTQMICLIERCGE